MSLRGCTVVYGYSSDVLGFVVEKVTGKTLEQYMYMHSSNFLDLHHSPSILGRNISSNH